METKEKEKMLISFVTVNFNNKGGLKKTFEAYRELHSKELSWGFEIIVVDSCSDDGSLDIIYASGDIINKLIIEKDEGLYDGMNKGLANASGMFVVFMNSGDRVIPDGFIELVSMITDEQLAYAGQAMQEMTGEKSRIFPLLLWLPNHQAIIFPANELKERGFLWHQYPISADLDHKALFWFSNRMRYFEITVAQCEPAGVSSNYNSFRDVYSRALHHLLIGSRNSATVPGVISFFAVLLKHTFFR